MRNVKLINEITDWSNLYYAYRMAARGKAEWPAVMAFHNCMGENFLRIEHELRTGTYKVERYRTKFVYEKKKRLIMALPFYDRVVQWAIYAKIYDYLDSKMIFHSYGSRRGKGTVNAVNNLQMIVNHCYKRNSECYYLKLDVSKFFYRIDHQKLKSLIRRYFPGEDELIKVLDAIIETDGYNFGLPRFKSVDDVGVEGMIHDVGMPVGNLLSQLFANVYLNELDQYCKHILKIRIYYRYMDDIVILCDSNHLAHYYLSKIEKFLNCELKLDLNGKTCIGKIKAGITFLSRRIYPNKIKLTRQATKRTKRSLIKTCRQYASYEISLKDAYATIDSYYGEIKHVDADNLKRWISRNVVLQRNRKF